MVGREEGRGRTLMLEIGVNIWCPFRRPFVFPRHKALKEGGKSDEKGHLEPSFGVVHKRKGSASSNMLPPRFGDELLVALEQSPNSRIPSISSTPRRLHGNPPLPGPRIWDGPRRHDGFRNPRRNGTQRHLQMAQAGFGAGEPTAASSSDRVESLVSARTPMMAGWPPVT